MASSGSGGATRNKRGKTGRPAAARRKPSWGRRMMTLLGYLTALGLVAVLLASMYVASIFWNVRKDLPSPDTLIDYNPGGITEIYATDKDPKTGKHVVLGRVFRENREYVPITKIPDVMKNATIAIEDERFYQHPGVDPRGIVRALYRNVRGGRTSEGGSTLTQQLARNVYLTQKRDINRKAQEILLAIQIEKNYSKEQILEMYLNEVCYGVNTYGVQAAAKLYFNKRVGELSVSQAALLAGIPQRPSDLEPFGHKNAAITRRNIVLAKMGELGFLKPAQVALCQSNGVRLAPPPSRQNTAFKAPYFTNQYVLRQLIDRYGEDAVYRGGLKVYTTLNSRMQHAAEQALVSGVRNARSGGVREGALVCVEPRTGFIRAMVGGVDYRKNQFNNAVHGRQPGSSFKPFVYAAAFDLKDWGPYTSVDNRPRNFGGRGSKAYRPTGGGPHGQVSIRTALTYSYNVAAVDTASKIGIRNVVSYAKNKFGIASELKPDLSLALGSHNITPLEMAAAYAVFANRGSRAIPMGIIRVLDHENNLLESNAPQVEQSVIPESAVSDMNDCLANVVARGTAASAPGIHEVSNAHGKTGTTNENRDAWFVGYTPRLSTAVWVCGVQRIKKNNRDYVKYLPMAPSVQGGRLCAPIWARFMKEAEPIQRKAGEPVPSIVKLPAALKKMLAAAVPISAAEPDRSQDEPLPAAPLRQRQERSDRAREAAAAAETTRGAAQPATPDARAVSAAATGTEGTPAAANVAAPPVVVEAAPPVAAAVSPPRMASVPPPPVPRALSLSAVSRSVVVAPPPAPPPAAAPPRLPPPPRLVTLSICPDSGRRATRWCPETSSRSLLASRAPRGLCRVHRPRPGDG